ncbi:helix-turn-helix domain-containing protein [Corynebacterium sanguinis]|uniref:helix-turn-helix domain-containing protein n=1 Tax=Corynebacterium sanguinis TaxID=2594913 RepID=UPI00118649A0|nr:helix-turn-helix domain-containing protein [Corynebacterium sanguinis]MCT2024298.1 helix-turn-helix domain-containing protein [Corynebacterium sanguinis]QDR77637.1 helix-turn-helix domain-containing protein [Corynebacterium sanguinis]
MPQKQLTDEQRQAILDHRADGWTLREIAREIGCSPATVSRTLRNAGVDTNPSITLEAAQARWENARAASYDMLANLLDDIDSLSARMWEPYTTYLNGPDGPVAVTLAEPPLSEVARIADQMRKTAVQIHQLQEQIDRGSDTDKARGILQDLFEGFKMVAALAEPDNNPGTYDSDYDVNTDPEQQQ